MIKITAYSKEDSASYDVSLKYDNIYGSYSATIDSSSEEFAKAFSFNNKDYSGILPPGVVALDKNVVVYECPPTHKLVQYTECPRDSISSKTPYVSATIPVPWQIYIAIFNNEYQLVDTYMYYSKNSIIQSGYLEHVYLPTLINFYSNGHLCRPFYASMSDTDFYPKNVSGVIAASYDAVWSSGWNSDLVDALINYNQDMKFAVYSESSRFKSYFVDKYGQGKYNELVMSMSWLQNRDTIFSSFVKSMEELTLEDAMNWCYPIPSFNQTRDQDLSNISEQASSDFYADEVSCVHGEDCEDEDCEYHLDHESYLEDRRMQFWSSSKTFEEVLNNVLSLQKLNLDYLDPVSNFFNSPSKIFAKTILHICSQSSYQGPSEEEPF